MAIARFEDNLKTMYYPFAEWPKCFKRWQELWPVYGKSMQLVISVSKYISGLWIEAHQERRYEADKILRTNQQVKFLESHVRAETRRLQCEPSDPRIAAVLISVESNGK